jgi:hypothetical protein
MPQQRCNAHALAVLYAPAASQKKTHFRCWEVGYKRRRVAYTDGSTYMPGSQSADGHIASRA